MVDNPAADPTPEQFTGEREPGRTSPYNQHIGLVVYHRVHSNPYRYNSMRVVLMLSSKNVTDILRCLGRACFLYWEARIPLESTCGDVHHDTHDEQGSMVRKNVLPARVDVTVRVLLGRHEHSVGPC